MRTGGRQLAAAAATALLGVALAVALAFLAGRLSTQHIALGGERPGAGAVLVTPHVPRVARAPQRPPRIVTTPPPTVESGDGTGAGDD